MHRRTLSHLLHMQDAPGAAEAVTSMDVTSVSTYRTNRRWLSVLPAGSSEDRVLSRCALERLCQRTRGVADIVLLDCPPLLPVAEAYTIGDVAGGTVLVVRAAQTPYDVLASALCGFATEKILGAVLNRAAPSRIPYFRKIYGYYERQGRASP
jgi:Mrp family chromosome partitioning ATPase